MIEGLQLPIPQRMGLLRVTLTLSLIVSLLLSFNLWAGERTFPYTPVFSRLVINPPLDMLLVALLLLLLVSSMIFRWHRLIIFLSLTISALLVLSDVNRLQPWFYIYSMMLLVFVFYNGRVDDSNRFTSRFIMLQVILASVYFFCGLSQLNSWFVESEFSGIISPLRTFISERQFLFLKRAGVVIPYLLMFVGCGLIISPVRYLAITLALIMHVVLIVLLFPSAQNQNYALWFSNLSFAIMLVILFSGKTKQRYFSPSFLLQVPLFYVVVILFAVMPFFNSRGYWPDYLSSNFKSGKNKSVDVKLEGEVYRRLPLYQKSFCSYDKEVYIFDYKRWCSNELKVECFPEKPVFNSIYNYLQSVKGSNVKETQLAFAD